MKKPTLDPEEWLVSLKDVKLLWISMWRSLLRWAFLGGIASLLYFGRSEVKFEATASFKEGVERYLDQENLFRNFIGGMIQESKPKAGSVMKSNQVLRPVVEKMGLQIQPVRFRGRILQFFHRFKEAFRAERRKLLSEVDPFTFRDVSYELEEVLNFHLFFKDQNHFLIFDQNKQNVLGEASVGSPVQLEKIAFTLLKPPKSLRLERHYSFSVSHWSVQTEELRSLFKINADKVNHYLINITLEHRDRFLAQTLVNELMAEYQKYLKKEYDHVAKEQLVYLENKQNQVLNKLDGLFNQHTSYLRQNLNECGFAGLEQESQSLLGPHQQMYNKVLSINIELSRLEEIEKEGKVIVVAEEGAFPSKLSHIAERINELKQQRDLLELSICQETVNSLDVKKSELNELQREKLEVEKLIQDINLGGEISSFEFNEGLSLWAKAIKDPEERVDFTEYLKNFVRLLSMREKILQDRFFYGNSIPEELEGVDLASARGLYLEYNNKLDCTHAKIRHLQKLKEQIPNQDINLAPLCSVLGDSISQRLIHEASDLEFKIKDKKHHTLKEEKKWLEEIGFIRNMLVDHLDQLIVVEDLNAKLFQEKMSGLQKISLDHIHRQLTVLDEQGFDSIKERKKALLLEKELLLKEMEKIRSSLAHMLPEKWRFEKWLGIKTEMITRIMETVTEIVESKTMASQMHKIESKPLDIALTPTAPKHPMLILKASFGGFTLSMLIFSFALVKRLHKGFPLSLEKIKALKLPCLGPISSFCDGPEVEKPTGQDLDLLRQVALFSENAKVIGLIGGKGPDYTYALGENLARRHVLSIIVRCDFHTTYREKDTPGILQVWKNETSELPIRKGKGFDYITAGGFSPYGTEIVQSESFSNLIQLLKKKYDWVYLFFRSSLSSAESMAALRLCDKAVVTVCCEQTEELTPFVDWGYDENSCRLTFITRS